MAADSRRMFGNAAEHDAAEFLMKKGFNILYRQYRNRYGEIDVIAQDGDELVMVEVKARHNATFGYPEEAVTAAKLRKIAAVAEVFVSDYPQRVWRIDVVAIEYGHVPPRFTHLLGVG